MTILLSIIGLFLAAITAPLIVELFMVTVASFLPRRRTRNTVDLASRRLAVVVPAHNEQTSIALVSRACLLHPTRTSEFTLSPTTAPTPQSSLQSRQAPKFLYITIRMPMEKDTYSALVLNTQFNAAQMLFWSLTRTPQSQGTSSRRCNMHSLEMLKLSSAAMRWKVHESISRPN